MAKTKQEPSVDTPPIYYDVIPEYNSAGRLCNYHTGDGDTVRVPAAEWERFNELAGRQHEVIDGVVTYNPDLPTAYPDGTEPPLSPLEALRQDRLDEISVICQAVITGGVDVETSQGAEHFGLSETDQINITNLSLQIAAGAPAVLYHADGQICRPFTPEEVSALAAAAVRHVTYHTTLYNHLKAWVRRTDDMDELAAITYASPLPDDLATHMAALLGGGA